MKAHPVATFAELIESIRLTAQRRANLAKSDTYLAAEHARFMIHHLVAKIRMRSSA